MRCHFNAKVSRLGNFDKPHHVRRDSSTSDSIHPLLGSATDLTRRGHQKDADWLSCGFTSVQASADLATTPCAGCARYCLVAPGAGQLAERAPAFLAMRPNWAAEMSPHRMRPAIPS
jgi:hypothetical protein